MLGNEVPSNSGYARLMTADLGLVLHWSHASDSDVQVSPPLSPEMKDFATFFGVMTEYSQGTFELTSSDLFKIDIFFFK